MSRICGTLFEYERRGGRGINTGVAEVAVSILKTDRRRPSARATAQLIHSVAANQGDAVCVHRQKGGRHQCHSHQHMQRERQAVDAAGNQRAIAKRCINDTMLFSSTA